MRGKAPKTHFPAVEYIMKDTKQQLIGMLERYADSYGMLECTDIIVGYSGGADSSLLLFALVEIANKRGICVTCAHINHMLRGDEADADEAFCKKECERYGIPLRTLRVDISALSKERSLGTEECARNVRYEFFSSIKKELEAKQGAKVFIATAHNATDNAETVLFNLTRGAGLCGVCGIPPVRDGYIVRPILFLSKEQVYGYCHALSIGYVTDRTNTDTVYTRNRIRHNVLPELRSINPSLEASVIRASKLLSADSDYIDSAALDYYKKAPKPLDTSALSGLHISILSRVLCLYFEEEGAGYEYTHIEKCVSLLKKRKSFCLSLINKKRVSQKDGFLYIENDSRKTENENTAWELELCMGENILPDGSEIFIFDKIEQIEKLKTQNVYKLFIQQTLSGDTISNTFTARSRREGDTIVSGGHTHKIKKLFSECKIPLSERYRLPIIERDGRIVWAVSVRAADKENATHMPLYFIYTRV